MAKFFDELASRTMSPASVRRAEARAKILRSEMLLSDLRKASGYSQKQLAALVKVQQPSLSKMEKSSDMQITTLQKLVEAMGGEVEVVAKFDKKRVKLTQFTKLAKTRSA